MIRFIAYASFHGICLYEGQYATPNKNICHFGTITERRRSRVLTCFPGFADNGQGVAALLLSLEIIETVFGDNGLKQ